MSVPTTNGTRTARWDDHLAAALTGLGEVAILAMMLHICADVFGRHLFGAPLVGTLEFVSYLYMISVVYLPLAATQIARSHVIVEVFTQHLSLGVRHLLDQFALVLTGLFVGCIAWWGLREAWRSFSTHEVIAIVSYDVPLWPTRWLLAIGLLAMLLVIIAQFVRGWRDGPSETPPPAEDGDHQEWQS